MTTTQGPALTQELRFLQLKARGQVKRNREIREGNHLHHQLAMDWGNRRTAEIFARYQREL